MPDPGTQNTRYGNRSARIEDRVPTELYCHVIVNGHKVQRLVITDLSKHGLQLRGEGLYLRLSKGDKLVVGTEIDGDRVMLEGVVVRFSILGNTQRIALGSLHWYNPEQESH
jgi:hypothetical protein